MLQSLDLQSLQTRRNINKLIIMYKMINGNLYILYLTHYSQINVIQEEDILPNYNLE